MKRLLTVSLLLLFPSLVHAQRFVEQKNADIVYAYDVTAGSYTYCRLLGVQQDPFGNPVAGGPLIKTSGSSTTVTEATASTNPFAPIGVGDVLYISVGPGVQAPTVRAVTAKASDASITVDSAITLTGNAWSFKKLSCGTGITDGWIPVGLFATLNFTIELVSLTAASDDFQVECKKGVVTSAAAIIDTTSMAAPGTYSRVITDGVWDACRVGLKVTGDAGVQSINASLGYKR